MGSEMCIRDRLRSVCSLKVMNIITVSNKGEHSMAMGVQVDGEDTLSNEDTPSDNVGMPVYVVSSGIYSGRSVAHQP